MLGAQLAHPGEVAGRGRQHAGRPDHGLQDDGGERPRPLEPDHLVEVGQRPLALLPLGGRVERRPVQVRPEEPRDPGGAEVGGPAPRLAGEGHRGGRVPVVAAVGRQHLVLAGVQSCHPDGVLDRLGAAVGEEDLGQPVTREVVEHQPGGLGAHPDRVLGCRGEQPVGLVLDRLHHHRVLVADVGEHQLGREVEQPVAVAVPHPRARPPASTIGSSAACADQEWNTCARSSSYARADSRRSTWSVGASAGGVRWWLMPGTLRRGAAPVSGRGRPPVVGTGPVGVAAGTRSRTAAGRTDADAGGAGTR